jgi:hypothetical protein
MVPSRGSSRTFERCARNVSCGVSLVGGAAGDCGKSAANMLAESERPQNRRRLNLIERNLQRRRAPTHRNGVFPK